MFNTVKNVSVNELDWIKTVHEKLGDILVEFFLRYAKEDAIIGYSGGVAQNVIWNTLLKKEFPNIIIPPHSSDEGISLGAIEWLRKYHNLKKINFNNFPYNQSDISVNNITNDNIIKIANYLAEGKIIGWYQGNGEIGPRALGNRSILMDPRIKDGKKSKEGKDSKDGKEEKYEFEIEYDIKQLSPQLIQESLWLIMDYFQTNLTIDTVERLLIGPFARFDKDARLMPPKPVNIKLDSYQKLKANPYTVTNKLDGERFLLFFLDERVYARQGEKVVYITNCDKKWDYTLIDVEFFKGQFYFFDCYMFQNQSLRYELLDQRLKLAEEAVKINPTLFVMKKFYKNLYKDTETLLETLSKEDNDGLIYTPQQISPDQPVYKWKFPEKMSIDFRVIKVGQDGTKYKYYLCVYTPKDQKGETHFETEYGSANYVSDVELQDRKI